MAELWYCLFFQPKYHGFVNFKINKTESAKYGLLNVEIAHKISIESVEKIRPIVMTSRISTGRKKLFKPKLKWRLAHAQSITVECVSRHSFQYNIDSYSLFKVCGSKVSKPKL